MIPQPKAIWADQHYSPEAQTPSPVGCIDCPPDTPHNQIYFQQGSSYCYDHLHDRQGQALEQDYNG